MLLFEKPGCLVDTLHKLDASHKETIQSLNTLMNDLETGVLDIPHQLQAEKSLIEKRYTKYCLTVARSSRATASFQPAEAIAIVSDAQVSSGSEAETTCEKVLTLASSKLKRVPSYRVLKLFNSVWTGISTCWAAFKAQKKINSNSTPNYETNRNAFLFYLLTDIPTFLLTWTFKTDTYIPVIAIDVKYVLYVFF